MDKELIGYISGWIVIASAVPYLIRVWQRKVRPNVVGWTLWGIIGISLLLTYKSSGAEDNIWPAVIGAINPNLVAILAVVRRTGEREKIKWWEWLCIFLCSTSLIVWWFVRTNQDLSQYALYIGILADACAAIPILVFVRAHPDQDRPFAWVMFILGYGLSAFAIREHTLANYALPAYMCTCCWLIVFPLVKYRIKNQIPLREWI